MTNLAIATDYDGTLAHHDRVDDRVFAALERYNASGRSLILVTGRVLDELKTACPRLDLFDRVVAENGALLYRPADGSERVLAERTPAGFVEALRARGVGPISVGRVVVATWEPHSPTVRDVIREMGLELDVILNKRAVMVLPAGVDKASGLAAALDELHLDPNHVAGVGDAENDHAFLDVCGLSAAVANALPALRERVDVALAGDHGAGVIEFIDALLEGRYDGRTPRPSR